MRSADKKGPPISPRFIGQVNHPNCIKLFDVYITPRKVYLVTELVTGGELLDRCDDAELLCHVYILKTDATDNCRVTEKGNYTEKDAANLIKQILEGVAYLHANGKWLPAISKRLTSYSPCNECCSLSHRNCAQRPQAREHDHDERER